MKQTVILYAFCVLCLCLAPFSVQALSDSDYNIRSLAPFNSYFPAGTALSFQPDIDDATQILTIHVINGTLNGTNCQVWNTLTKGGKYAFNSQAAAFLQINFTEGLGRVSVRNEAVTSGILYPIGAGVSYDVVWSSLVSAALPLMLIIGIVGLILIIVGPLYLVSKLRARDMDGVKLGIVLSAFGFAFTIAWLWGAA